MSMHDIFAKQWWQIGRIIYLMMLIAYLPGVSIT